MPISANFRLCVLSASSISNESRAKFNYLCRILTQKRDVTQTENLTKASSTTQCGHSTDEKTEITLTIPSAARESERFDGEKPFVFHLHCCLPVVSVSSWNYKLSRLHHLTAALIEWKLQDFLLFSAVMEGKVKTKNKLKSINLIQACFFCVAAEWMNISRVTELTQSCFFFCDSHCVYQLRMLSQVTMRIAIKRIFAYLQSLSSWHEDVNMSLAYVWLNSMLITCDKAEGADKWS